MVLTQQQENIINKYLSEVNNYLNSVSDIEKRKRLLIELKKKIFSVLQRSGKNYISDEELCHFLYNEFGEPELQAGKLLNPINPSTKLILDVENRVWLGVCAGLAVRTRLPVMVVRFLFALLGLCGGVGFIFYLLLYFFLYFSSGVYKGKKIQWFFFVYQLILTATLLLSIHLITIFLLKGIEYLHIRWTATSGGSSVDISKVYHFVFLSFLFYMWTGILSAIMGGLPLKNDWDKTFRNIRDAQIALLVLFEFAGIVWVIYRFIMDSIVVFRNLMI